MAFSDAEIDGIRKLATEIDQSQVKIKGLTAEPTEAHVGGSVLSESILAGLAAAKHGAKGIAGAVISVLGKALVGRTRAAGMREAGDLIKQAMMDPELARQLVAMVPSQRIPRQALSVANVLRRYAIFPAQQLATPQPAIQ